MSEAELKSNAVRYFVSTEGRARKLVTPKGLRALGFANADAVRAALARAGVEVPPVVYDRVESGPRARLEKFKRPPAWVHEAWREYLAGATMVALGARYQRDRAYLGQWFAKLHPKVFAEIKRARSGKPLRKEGV